MRIPKPGTKIKRGKSAQVVVTPWGASPANPWMEKTKTTDTAARREARAKSQQLYPNGKALARLRYFEVQRGFVTPTLPGVHLAMPRARKVKAQQVPAKLPYARAYAVKMKMQPASVNLPAWRELGPTLIPHGQSYGHGPNSQPPVSGRCVGIDIDPANPRHLVLCSAGGGLWESQDGGNTWRPLTDQQPVLAMGAIARSPSSPNVMYAATGEGDGQIPLGIGLLRSTDGGLTWAHSKAADLAGEAIYDLAVHPTDPAHLFIGGTLADLGYLDQHVESERDPRWMPQRPHAIGQRREFLEPGIAPGRRCRRCVRPYRGLPRAFELRDCLRGRFRERRGHALAAKLRGRQLRRRSSAGQHEDGTGVV